MAENTDETAAAAAARIRASRSRDEARGHLDGLTRAQLRAAAAELGTKLGYLDDTKTRMVERLVNSTIGARLDGAAQQGITLAEYNARLDAIDAGTRAPDTIGDSITPEQQAIDAARRQARREGRPGSGPWDPVPAAVTPRPPGSHTPTPGADPSRNYRYDGETAAVDSARRHFDHNVALREQQNQVLGNADALDPADTSPGAEITRSVAGSVRDRREYERRRDPLPPPSDETLDYNQIPRARYEQARNDYLDRLDEQVTAGELSRADANAIAAVPITPSATVTDLEQWWQQPRRGSMDATEALAAHTEQTARLRALSDPQLAEAARQTSGFDHERVAAEADRRRNTTTGYNPGRAESARPGSDPAPARHTVAAQASDTRVGQPADLLEQFRAGAERGNVDDMTTEQLRRAYTAAPHRSDERELIEAEIQLREQRAAGNPAEDARFAEWIRRQPTQPGEVPTAEGGWNIRAVDHALNTASDLEETSAAGAATDPFQPGDRVVHPRRGSGTYVEKHNWGPDETSSYVEFDDGDIAPVTTANLRRTDVPEQAASTDNCDHVVSAHQETTGRFGPDGQWWEAQGDCVKCEQPVHRIWSDEQNQTGGDGWNRWRPAAEPVDDQIPSTAATRTPEQIEADAEDAAREQAERTYREHVEQGLWPGLCEAAWTDECTHTPRHTVPARDRAGAKSDTPTAQTSAWGGLTAEQAQQTHPLPGGAANGTGTMGEINSPDRYLAAMQAALEEAAGQLDDANACVQFAEAEMARMDRMFAAACSDQVGLPAGQRATVQALRDSTSRQLGCARRRQQEAIIRLGILRGVTDDAAKHQQLVGQAAGGWYNPAAGPAGNADEGRRMNLVAHTCPQCGSIWHYETPRTFTCSECGTRVPAAGGL